MRGEITERPSLREARVERRGAAGERRGDGSPEMDCQRPEGALGRVGEGSAFPGRSISEKHLAILQTFWLPSGGPEYS